MKQNVEGVIYNFPDLKGLTVITSNLKKRRCNLSYTNEKTAWNPFVPETEYIYQIPVNVSIDLSWFSHSGGGTFLHGEMKVTNSELFVHVCCSLMYLKFPSLWSCGWELGYRKLAAAETEFVLN